MCSHFYSDRGLYPDSSFHPDSGLSNMVLYILTVVSSIVIDFFLTRKMVPIMGRASS